MLIPVIMAGGVGSRLWPASREARPKQFLAFAGPHSLFQQSLLRLGGMPDVAAPVVVCNEAHRFLVAEQLREIGVTGADIILEPAGRNTAPAVALAALSVLQRPAAETAHLLVLAADHLIPDLAAFHAAIGAGLPHSAGAALVTFGIVPNRPETGYGYIQCGTALGSTDEAGFAVQRFVEKPDRATAQAYVDSGDYYWNSGMFMFQPHSFLAELAKFEPLILQHCRSALQQAQSDLGFCRIPREAFMQAPAISIDYAVMERTDHAVVVPLDAGWTDLGAWSAVWEQGPFDEQNNVGLGDVMFQDSCNSFVQAESRLVTLVGMDNAVVVETADAVLVANKARVQEVKEIVQRLNSMGRPEAVLHRKVYRPWGSYEGLAQADGFQVKRIVVKPGAALSLQLHYKRAEHWIVVQGVATVTCGDEVFELSQNESTYIPQGTRHRLENRTGVDVVLIEVQCGSYLGEDDIVRFEDVYGRTRE
jgi:mannose-1-phosphate guanylyltransferase/mannose-6-phosphate isomerase